MFDFRQNLFSENLKPVSDIVNNLNQRDSVLFGLGLFDSVLKCH